MRHRDPPGHFACRPRPAPSPIAADQSNGQALQDPELPRSRTGAIDELPAALGNAVVLQAGLPGGIVEFVGQPVLAERRVGVMLDSAIEHAAKRAVTGPREDVPVARQVQCIDELAAMSDDSSVGQDANHAALEQF